MSPSSFTEKTSSGLNIESDLAGLDSSTSPTMGKQQSDQEAIREITLMPLYNMAESTSPKVAGCPSNNAGANANSLAPITGNSFTRFMDLPTELRLAIWELSCETPRFVDFWMRTTRNIKCPNVDAKHRRRTEKYLNSFACRPVYKSHAKTVPSILHTSQEARAVGLNYFTPLFNGYQHNIPVPSFTQPQVYQVPPQFYFNRAYDILVIPPLMSAAMGYETMNHLMKKICSGDIRKIAVSSFEGSYFFPLKQSTSTDVYKSLEEVILYWMPWDHKPLFEYFDDRNLVDFEFRSVDDPTVSTLWSHARQILESGAESVRFRHGKTMDLFLQGRSDVQSPGELPSIKLTVLQIKRRLQPGVENA